MDEYSIDNSKLNCLNFTSFQTENKDQTPFCNPANFSTEETIKQAQDGIEIVIQDLIDKLGLRAAYYRDSIDETPKRVAKMMIHETFRGLIKSNYPNISLQKNHFNYREMLLESGIEINSCCEHHLVPILGKAHIAYLPKKNLIGLSKLNRIADFHARRPQIQERLTVEIAEDLSRHLDNQDVAICIDALHCCVKMRGIQDSNCVTRTYHLMGQFNDQKYRGEFFSSIPDLKEFRL